MILKGNRRGGAKDLALHLMKDENDHVQVQELRGFVSGDLMGALNETYAISKGTKCQKFMYSMSVNPPPGETASTADILEAIEKSEKVLKLTGQPRAIVFHEKDGRRHAHAVWSLIDAQAMKALRLRDDRKKLQPLTLELFIQHGWKVPEGLLDRENRDPRSFTLKEYHQARKHGRDPRRARSVIQTAWAISDSRPAFDAALEERGMKLAKGDRAGLVCVDMFGEVHPLPKRLGLRIKDVRARIGSERENPRAFQSVDEAREKTAALMLSMLQRFKGEIEETEDRKTEEFERRKAELVRRQRLERQSMVRRQEERQAEEARIRQSRFRTGFRGLWDALRGHNRRIRALNEREALAALRRDQEERDTLIQRHIEQRRHVDLFRRQLRKEFIRERRHIERSMTTYNEMQPNGGRNDLGL
ncbi:MAG: relaxase [Azospirillum sp.]|nr:relaxase [Azospirillum sp.]